MSDTQTFRQGIIAGLFIGLCIGLVISGCLAWWLSPKPLPSAELVKHKVTIADSKSSLSNAEPSLQKLSATNKKTQLSKKLPQTSPPVIIPELTSNEAPPSGEAKLQALLAQHTYQDLSEYARMLISEQQAAYAWHYLIEAEIQQGFYTNAINLAVEHINSAFSHTEREQAIQTALNTLEKIDQLERVKGNTLQLIDLYQYSIEILSHWLSNTDSQRITLSKLYLSIGESNLALNTLSHISSSNLAAQSLEQKIEKDSFITQHIPLKKVGKHYLIEVFIENQALQLLIDTGASISTINQATFQAIENFIHFDNLNSISVNTAGGVKIGQVIQISQFYFADKLLNNTQFIVLDMHSEHFDGLLGMNVLEHFDFTLDQQNQKLVLSKLL